MEIKYHKPVLLEEAIAGLKIRPDGVYVDVTYGGGGHSNALLEKLNENGRLFGFDQDADAQAHRIEDPRFEFVAANFRHLTQYLKYYHIQSVQGILADFGVSSHQFDTAERGFSTRWEGRLDMRMNQAQVQDAHAVINTYEESELSRIFFQYGELKNARSLAKTIVLARSEKPIDTTSDLTRAIKALIPERWENKVLAQLFQAVRIEVNEEMEVLQSFLEQAASVLAPGGRLVCISYHSLEDRCVKRFINSGNFKGETEKDFYGNTLKPLKKVGKLITPSPAEIKQNSRARSAKMRIAEKQ